MDIDKRNLSPKPKRVTKVSFIGFIFILNLNGILDLGHFDKVALGLFLIYILAKREWLLLHCAVLFLLWSLGDLLSYWEFLRLPALGLILLFSCSTLVILPFRQTRAALSWIAFGKIDRVTMLLLIIIGFVSSGALIVWALWTDNLGLGLRMVEDVAHYPRPLIILLGIPLFALINALAEEIIYRGILHEALTHTFSNGYLAVVLQATAFAAIHYSVGFPNGVWGYLMVLCYGVMLGYLKRRTSGILSPYLSHIVADLTIGYYLVCKV
jgi:membrane protease YdiL (CAAX protease family)